MDGVGRIAPGEYRSLSVRWRRLAEDATTPRTTIYSGLPANASSLPAMSIRCEMRLRRRDHNLTNATEGACPARP